MHLDHPSAVATRFNDCINAADLEGLAALMTEDHAFIDSAGSVVAGKAAVIAAWSSFFAAFPGYRNHFVRNREAHDTVAIEGRSTSSDPRLHGPALWRVKVLGGKVAEWQVYKDSAENRRNLGL